MKKIGKKNVWERYLEYEIEDWENFRIPCNKVLIDFNPLENECTNGGIIVVRDMNFASHAIRRGIVKKVPEKLYCQLRDPSSMPWVCDMDLKIGDEVYLTHQDSYHAYLFSYKEHTYKLVDYSGILLAKNNDQLTMCNGYLLLEKTKKIFKYLNYEVEKEVKEYGIIKAIGKPNKFYKTYDSKYKKEVLKEDSQQDFQIGQKVFIEDITRVFDLEDFMHAKFDNRKIYNVCSRRRLGAIVE